MLSSVFSLDVVALFSHATNHGPEHPCTRSPAKRSPTGVRSRIVYVPCTRVRVTFLSVFSRCPPKRDPCSRLSTSVRRGRRWRNEPVAPRAPTQAPSRTNPPLPPTRARYHTHTVPATSSMPEIRRTNTREMSRIVRQLHSAESIMDIRTDGPPGPPPLTTTSNGCPTIHAPPRTMVYAPRQAPRSFHRPAPRIELTRGTFR